MWSNSRCCLHTSATLQMQLFVSDLPLNQSEYTAESPLIRIEWTTGNGILMSSSHWPTYNKFPPAHAAGKLEAAFNEPLNIKYKQSES